MLKFRLQVLNCSNTVKALNFFSCRNMSSNQCPILYGDEISPPVRFVLMTASMLEFNVNFHKIDLFKSDQNTEFYKKINPLQKVPALDTGTTVLRDSHAIALYICHASQHARNKSIYPVHDTLQLAQVHQMLFFNSGTLFPIDSFIFTEYFKGNWPISDEIKNQWYKALDFLEEQLIHSYWLSGNQVTLGDLCCGATVSSVLILLPLLNRHSRIQRWINNLQELPCFNINRKGIDLLQQNVNASKK